MYVEKFQRTNANMLSCDNDSLVGSVNCVAGGGQSDLAVGGIVNGVETLTT